MPRPFMQSIGALRRATTIDRHWPIPSPSDRLKARLRNEFKVDKRLPFRIHLSLLHLEQASAYPHKR